MYLNGSSLPRLFAFFFVGDSFFPVGEDDTVDNVVCHFFLLSLHFLFYKMNNDSWRESRS